MKFILFLVFSCLLLANGQDFGSNLANLDFANIIGGPMQAVIDAQNLAARTTVEFVNECAFNADQTLRMVDFGYTKTVNGTSVDTHLSVPFLTILPIPFIEIESTEIELNIKMNSAASQTSSTAVGVSLSVSRGFPFGVKFSASVQFQAKTSDDLEVKKQYSMKVYVKARQVSAPPGMVRIMDWMEKIITEV